MEYLNAKEFHRCAQNEFTQSPEPEKECPRGHFLFFVTMSRRGFEDSLTRPSGQADLGSVDPYPILESDDVWAFTRSGVCLGCSTVCNVE